MRVAPPLALALALVPLASAATAEVRHVDASASGTADGTSWTDAFVDLQHALAAAQPGDELWVAAGVYVPSTWDATASFVLRDGVALYGGFDGTETARAQRDWIAHETHLSGDIAGDDVVGSGLYWYTTWQIGTANAGHVLRAEGVGPATVVDGFTIRNGATGPVGTGAGTELMFGGGLYAVDASPTIKNCTFLHNEAAFASGAAVYLSDSSPRIEDCRFLENYTHLGSGGGLMSTGTSVPRIARCEFARNVVVAGSVEAYGAGLCHNGSAPIEVESCRFEDNQTKQFYPVSTSTTYGGGLFAFTSGITVRDSVFVGNKAQYGGGMITWGPSLVVGCLFAENEAFVVAADPYPEIGGVGAAVAVHAFQPVEMRVVNCTIAFNRGKQHVAVNGGWNANASIENCVIWGNTATHPEVQGGWKAELGGNFDVSHSCIATLFDPPAPGEDPIEPQKLPGCIDVDPSFVAPGSFYAAGDLRLAAGSPCADAGSNALLPADALLDLSGGGRRQDDPLAVDVGTGGAPIVDMGCHERLADAFRADTPELAVSTGGVQTLALDAGPAHGGELYWVVGSLSGTWPGFGVAGVHVPLNFDAYSLLTLTGANQGHLVDTLGVLDSAGRATAAIALPPGLPPTWIGLRLDHAFVALGATTPTFASGSTPVVLVP